MNPFNRSDSDTGYRASKEGPTCPVFKQIGEKYGGIDFAAIPIWRGGTLSFVSSFGLRVSSFLPSLHTFLIPCDRAETFTASSLPNLQLSPEALTLAMHAPPDDAVCIHKDVRSRATMGIHFATFVGSEDEVRLFGHLHLHVSPRRVTTRSYQLLIAYR